MEKKSVTLVKMVTESLRSFNSNLAFTCVVKAIEEFSKTVKQQQLQIKTQKTKHDKFMNVIIDS